MIAPEMPVSVTVSDVSDGRPPIFSVTLMAIGIVLDFGASESGLGHELGYRGLLEERSVRVEEPFRGGEGVHEMRGHDEIGQTKRGKEDLAERSHIDHPVVRIEPLKRGERPPGVAILAAVVVLDDRRAGATGPLKQRETPRQRHGDTQRKLVRRRDEDQPRRGLPPRSAAEAEALRVDRYGPHLHPRRNRGSASPCIARVLDPDRVSRIGEEPEREAEGLLRPAHDDDVVGAATHAARGPEIGGDGFTERPVPGGVAVAE
jgi:hypothetical protein